MSHHVKLLLSVCVLMCVACQTDQAREAGSSGVRPVNVGVVLPLSGELGNFGTTVLNGIQLAVEEAASDSFPVRLYIEDSQAEPANAVSGFRKLVTVNRASFIIGSLTSGETGAMAPLAEEARIVLISPTASNAQLTSAGPYFYRVWPSDNYDGSAAAEYFYNQMGMRTAAIIHLRNDYATGLKDVFTQSFAHLGGQIQLTSGYNEQELDFRPLIVRLQALRPQLVYLPGHPRGIAAFLQQARELGFTSIFLANVAAEDQDFLTLAKGATDGLYYTAPAFDTASAATNAFASRYRSRFRIAPDIHAAKGYDAALVLLRGIQGRALSPDSMRAFLDSKIVFQGASGTFRFDPNGDVLGGVALKRYAADGQPNLVATLGAAIR
jgi:branched-chain amino acid transport system substrate-binding protein